MRLLFVSVLSVVLWTTTDALAHCEIPCGIYGDDARFSMIYEDITTIEKSMAKIDELSGDLGNINQLARWVSSKETHATRIQETVSQYFLTQRIKVPDMSDAEAVSSYQHKLALLHQMLVSAMKCKQTTDPANAARLHELTDEFKQAYTGA